VAKIAKRLHAEGMGSTAIAQQLGAARACARMSSRSGFLTSRLTEKQVGTAQHQDRDPDERQSVIQINAAHLWNKRGGYGLFDLNQIGSGHSSKTNGPHDTDLRELEFKKNQYGPLGESIVLRYQRGLFLPEGGATSLEKAARMAKADEVFIDLLRRFSEQGRNLSEKTSANNYCAEGFRRSGRRQEARLEEGRPQRRHVSAFRHQPDLCRELWPPV